MSGKSSRARRVEAVKAAEACAYGRIEKMPEHFDDRQERIFQAYYLHWMGKIHYLDQIYEDLIMVHGKTAKPKNLGERK